MTEYLEYSESGIGFGIFGLSLSSKINLFQVRICHFSSAACWLCRSRRHLRVGQSRKLKYHISPVRLSLKNSDTRLF